MIEYSMLTGRLLAHRSLRTCFLAQVRLNFCELCGLLCLIESNNKTRTFLWIVGARLFQVYPPNSNLLEHNFVMSTKNQPHK